MKSLNSPGQAHIAQDVTTLAMCWRVERTDGVTLAFTDYHEDLEVGGVTYEAASGMVQATATSSTSDLSVPNMDVETVFDSDSITREDILAGRYDYAELY